MCSSGRVTQIRRNQRPRAGSIIQLVHYVSPGPGSGTRHYIRRQFGRLTPFAILPLTTTSVRWRVVANVIGRSRWAVQITLTRRSVPPVRALINAINAPPSASDRMGGVYAYCVGDVVKVGYSKQPVVRKAQWMSQCRGEQQRWMRFYWEVPYAKKFVGLSPTERIIHLELKRLGAWKGLVHCRFCRRNHREKFDLRKCGGIAGLVSIVEARLIALGWIWRRVTCDSAPAYTIGHPMPRESSNNNGFKLVIDESQTEQLDNHGTRQPSACHHAELFSASSATWQGASFFSLSPATTSTIESSQTSKSTEYLSDKTYRKLLSTPGAMQRCVEQPYESNLKRKLAYHERLKRKIASYIDTEAVVDDGDDESEDEDDLDLQDFIPETDDQISDYSSLLNQYQPPPSIRRVTIEDDMQDSERIAQKFVDRARQERAPLPSSEAPADKHNLSSHVPTSFDLTASPLYAYRVPAHTEIQLMQFLTPSRPAGVPLAGIKSVFTKAPGSGTVYVETSDVAVLFNYMKNYSGLWRMPRAPFEIRERSQLNPDVAFPHRIELMDSLARILTHPDRDMTGRWARLAHKHGTLQRNDLVFVVDDDIFLAVPRVSYAGEPSTYALFDASNYTRLKSPLKPDPKTDTYILHNPRREFSKSGLQICSWAGKLSLFLPDGAPPSDFELNLFDSADDFILRSHPTKLLTTAVQVTDSVCITGGTYAHNHGRVVCTRFSGQMRAAFVYLEDFENRCPDGGLTRAIVESDRTVMVNTAHLRKNATALPQLPRVGDRVAIIEGKQYLWEVGRVKSIRDDFTIEVASSLRGSTTPGEDHMVVNISDVQQLLKPGDTVKMIRGCFIGRTGFLVHRHNGGYADIILCDVPSIVALTGRDRLDASTSALVEETTHLVPLCHLSLANLQHEFGEVDKTTEWPHPMMDTASSGKLEAFEDARKRYMHTGTEYIGLEVQIVHKHADKGKFGTIVGIHREIPRVPRSNSVLEWIEPEAQAELTVCLEFSNRYVTAAPAQLADRFTNIQIQQSALYKTLALIYRPQAVLEQLENAVVNPILPVITNGDPLSVADVGDNDGSWLMLPGLANKRVDVCIEGVNRTLYPKHASAKARQCEGRDGTLYPFRKPLHTANFHKSGVKVKLDKSGGTANIPADAIRPQRYLGPGVSIAEEEGRVVIIGPDVDGSRVHIGDYALVQPGAPIPDFPDFVQVKFTRHAGPPFTGWFQVEALCRATNTEITIGEIVLAATNF
ncbi:hypothetical protein K438DRAFT_2155553 [Mycena galopus ATCC 62051]|nr:hypothetical protein K438DRAFT_2155553 [Mycena galopus ATCC 62051]